ncbi:hypothetical protein Poli38472_008932 [Pythium oligandrum]|uniref:Uncharacterized protein n=1 Tax=Pythium oligandrum TaxID=41045 RepID=A0A8K1C4G7_PYTOL|nr:hypothetical protein Poli38472_008932 [Pythium oligandrum]|eukprot:TMW56284.1 hypothetical protein Poli38472_008932 [Pythium oligandrum]
MEMAGSMQGEGSAEDVRRRVRFDADADLRLLIAVRKHEPYAAEHGMKLKVWDDVAQEVYASSAKLQDARSSRRSVMDRFQLLFQMYEQGTLKLKRWLDSEGRNERGALVEATLKDIADSMANAKQRKGKRAQVSSPVSLKSEREGEESSGNGRKRRASTSGPESPPVGRSDAEILYGMAPEQTHPASSVSAALAQAARGHDPAMLVEILALKREKVAIKRRKLELMEKHHRELVELEHRRLDLKEKRLAAATSGSTI